jgi:hypothetical protein
LLQRVPRAPEDHVERRAHLVREVRRELADQRQPLRVVQPALERDHRLRALFERRARAAQRVEQLVEPPREQTDLVLAHHRRPGERGVELRLLHALQQQRDRVKHRRAQPQPRGDDQRERGDHADERHPLFGAANVLLDVREVSKQQRRAARPVAVPRAEREAIDEHGTSVARVRRRDAARLGARRVSERQQPRDVRLKRARGADEPIVLVEDHHAEHAIGAAQVVGELGDVLDLTVAHRRAHRDRQRRRVIAKLAARVIEHLCAKQPDVEHAKRPEAHEHWDEQAEHDARGEVQRCKLHRHATPERLATASVACTG